MFEYVIVDTPPLGAVVDAAVIAQYCDGAILVIYSDATRYRSCQKVKTQLERSGCKILGAVLNGESTRGRNSYYSRYSRSYYGKSTYGKYGGDVE